MVTIPPISKLSFYKSKMYYLWLFARTGQGQLFLAELFLSYNTMKHLHDQMSMVLMGVDSPLIGAPANETTTPNS